MIVSQILGILPILALGGFGIFGILLDGTISFQGFLQFLSPLFMLIPLIGSWVAYAKRNEKLAWILTSLPMTPVEDSRWGANSSCEHGFCNCG